MLYYFNYHDYLAYYAPLSYLKSIGIVETDEGLSTTNMQGHLS